MNLSLNSFASLELRNPKDLEWSSGSKSQGSGGPPCSSCGLSVNPLWFYRSVAVKVIRQLYEADMKSLGQLSSETDKFVSIILRCIFVHYNTQTL